MNSAEPVQIGIVGLGNVGTGVARILATQSARIARRAGRPIVLKRAVVRDLSRTRDVELPPGTLTNDVAAIMDDPSISIVCELMGGIHPAREVVLALLEAGKDVVTANKALLHECGDDLFSAARRLGRTIAFEAAVAGGIPIIAAVGQSMAANQIQRIQAILNGTSNFILSEMLLRQQPYDTALAEAQQLGYAEADPSLDVNGTDAAQKLGILSQLAFGVKVPTSEFHVSGIDCLELQDIRYAGQFGYTIKLLASARLTQNLLELSVRPTLIRRDQPLALVNGPFNAIVLEGDVVGSVSYAGRGAGQLPTASAVTADIIDLAIGRAQLTFERLDLWSEGLQTRVAPQPDVASRFYLRMLVEDRPHVMADITHILGGHGISLASVIQPEAPEQDSLTTIPTVPLVIMTHRTTAGRMDAARAELLQLAAVRRPVVVLAVAD